MKKVVMETIYNSSSGFIYVFNIYNLLGVRYRKQLPVHKNPLYNAE